MRENYRSQPCCDNCKHSMKCVVYTLDKEHNGAFNKGPWCTLDPVVTWCFDEQCGSSAHQDVDATYICDSWEAR
jgi:hypothetical protein